MPKYLYERDFEPPNALNENALACFRQLCEHADDVIELPLISGNTEQAFHKTR
jgi:hypothetical protein